MSDVDKEVQKREIWIDNIKVFACVLVVLGHFFQSMAKAKIIPDSALYEWFDKSIYYFHVPLFFICSGYVYQKYSRVNNFKTWWKNVLKKAFALGVPYFTFSSITWILKNVFANSVNSKASGIFETLFVTPSSPYWYLYCLFFVFLITPTFKSKQRAGIGLAVALLMKIVNIFSGGYGIYAVSVVLANEIWFVIGMSLSVFARSNALRKKHFCRCGFCMAILFILGSVVVYNEKVHAIIGFVLGLTACGAVILFFGYCFQSNVQNRLFGFLSKYTMPIFLMHTIFAAALRSILLKLGVISGIIHVGLGLTISFLAPALASEIMMKIKGMGFFLYPIKYIKLNSMRNQRNADMSKK